MKKLLIGVAALGISLSACGHGKAHTATTNAQVHRDESQASTIVNGCINKGGNIRVMIACVAPRGHGTAFVHCTVNQLHAGELKTKPGRETYLQSVYQCGVQNR